MKIASDQRRPDAGQSCMAVKKLCGIKDPLLATRHCALLLSQIYCDRTSRLSESMHNYASILFWIAPSITI